MTHFQLYQTQTTIMIMKRPLKGLMFLNPFCLKLETSKSMYFCARYTEKLSIIENLMSKNLKIPSPKNHSFVQIFLFLALIYYYLLS